MVYLVSSIYCLILTLLVTSFFLYRKLREMQQIISVVEQVLHSLGKSFTKDNSPSAITVFNSATRE